MSMLAGPRRKQKFTLNPRGKHWSEDPNKFGQKMMEKMGWSAGKGLGANEQGMTDHVRVKVKNDQVGIGYQKDKDDHWTEHQDDFNSFLQNLQKEQAGVVEETDDRVLSGKSLEEKSKQSQKRVHYKKFTRGKDVNKYSSKDLANIFGKRDLSEKTVVKEEIVEEEMKIVYDPIGSKDTTAGVLTVKGGNMNDYFKSKSQSNAFRVKEEPDDECETRVGFGYSAKSTSKFYVNDDGEAQESDGESQKYVGFGFTKGSESKSKAKKRVDLNYVYDNPCLDLNILDESTAAQKTVSKVVDLECSERVTPKKRKSEFSYDNQGLDLNCPDGHTPKKRKSEYSYENKGMDLGYSENQAERSEDVCEVTEESSESTGKKKSKKSKKVKHESLPDGIENLALDLNTPDRCTPKSKSESPVSECSMEVDDSVCAKNKPRIIKCEIISNGFDNLGLDLNYTYKLTPKKVVEVEAYENSALELDVSHGPTPKKNRKVESKDSSDAFDNPGLDENFPTPAKTKKANHNISNGICNPGLDENFPTPEKTKKANHNASNGICNPGLDLNFADTPTPKKCKKIKEKPVVFNGLENPGLDLEDKPTPKKSKRSKSSEVPSSGFENPALDLEFVDRPTPKKSKKSKNSSLSHEFENPGLEANSFTNEVCMDYEVSGVGVENNALDLSDEKMSKRRVTFNDQLEYNTDITKKKKKKNKNPLDKYEVVTDKLKKKHKHAEPESTTAFVNEGLDLYVKNEEEIENEINERKSKKGKRRKGRRMSLLETIEEAPEEENSNETPNAENQVTGEKDAVMSELSCENMCVDTADNDNKDVSTKKSKKKKKAKKDLAEDVEEVEVYVEPVEKKKKNKTVKQEPMEIVEGDSPEKENKCTKKDKTKKTDDKKNKKSTDDDVISLEDFLNDDEALKTKQKSNNQSTDNEKCTESQEIEETVPKENNENFHQRFKKTKQVMKSLFMKNPSLMFTGSNINEIKGYGSQFYDNY